MPNGYTPQIPPEMAALTAKNSPKGYAKGGKVKKTGLAKLHKGELVIPAKYVKDVSKTLKDKIKKNGGYNM